MKAAGKDLGFLQMFDHKQIVSLFHNSQLVIVIEHESGINVFMTIKINLRIKS